MPRHLEKPLQDPKYIQRVINTIRKAEDTLGDLVLWNVEKVEVPPDTLKKFLEARGIEKWAPVDIRKKTAARKALTHIKKLLESNELKVLVRKIAETDAEVRYAVVGERVDAARTDLEYGTMNQAVFDKTTASLTFTVEEVPEIREKYNYFCGVYTQREIQHMILLIVKLHGGIAMGDGSGMYFLPNAMKGIVEALDGLINIDLKCLPDAKCAFRAFGIVDKDRERKEMGNVFRSDILVDIKEAQDFMEVVIKNAQVNPDAKNVENSLTLALNRYKAATGKAMMYKELLGLNMDELQSNMQKAQATLNIMLGV